MKNENGLPQGIVPRSWFLKSDRSKWINEESVPRVGLKVQLTDPRVRWVGGETYFWFGKRVVTGRGEGSSGLKYDFLREQ